VTTPHIQQIIIHSKMEIFHFLLSMNTSTRTMYANEEYTTDSGTNRIRMDPPTQTYDHINDPNAYNLLNSHLPVLQTRYLVATMTQLLTSTLRQHHVCFCIQPDALPLYSNTLATSEHQQQDNILTRPIKILRPWVKHGKFYMQAQVKPISLQVKSKTRDFRTFFQTKPCNPGPTASDKNLLQPP